MLGSNSIKVSGIDQVVDSFLGRQGEMIIALRADFEVLHELEVMDDLATVGAFLPKTLGHFPFFVGWKFKDGF